MTLCNPSRHCMVNPSQAIRFFFPNVLIFFDMIPCNFCFRFLYPDSGTLKIVTIDSQMHVKILKNVSMKDIFTVISFLKKNRSQFKTIFSRLFN